MNTEKPSARDLPSGIGDEPEKRRYHHIRLNQLGAIKTCFIGDHRRVRHSAGNQYVDRDTGTVKVLRHDRAERLECGLGGPVGRGTCVQHRAQTGRDIDDAAPAPVHHFRHHGIRERQRCRRVHCDEAAPLIGRDLPEFERPLPAIRSNCSRADAGVVDQDVDAAKSGVRGLGDFTDRGVVGQIRLDGEEVGRLVLLTRVRREPLQRLTARSTPATRMPAANRPRTMAVPIPPAAPVTIATLWVSVIAGSFPCCPGLSYFGFEDGRVDAAVICPEQTLLRENDDNALGQGFGLHRLRAGFRMPWRAQHIVIGGVATVTAVGLTRLAFLRRDGTRLALSFGRPLRWRGTYAGRACWRLLRYWFRRARWD